MYPMDEKDLYLYMNRNNRIVIYDYLDRAWVNPRELSDFIMMISSERRVESLRFLIEFFEERNVLIPLYIVESLDRIISSYANVKEIREFAVYAEEYRKMASMLLKYFKKVNVDELLSTENGRNMIMQLVRARMYTPGNPAGLFDKVLRTGDAALIKYMRDLGF